MQCPTTSPITTAPPSFPSSKTLISFIFGQKYKQFPHFAGVPPTTCSAQSVGLVRYPTTLAPASGSVTVTTQCADNAHVRSGSSLSVRCTSSGSWSGTPVCECDTGYLPVTVSTGRQVCQCDSKYTSVTPNYLLLCFCNFLFQLKDVQVSSALATFSLCHLLFCRCMSSSNSWVS